MSQAQKTLIPKRKKKTPDEDTDTSTASISIEEKRKKLKELDGFIEDVLQEAGDDFLDEFRQVEGE